MNYEKCRQTFNKLAHLASEQEKFIEQTRSKTKIDHTEAIIWITPGHSRHSNAIDQPTHISVIDDKMDRMIGALNVFNEPGSFKFFIHLA